MNLAQIGRLLVVLGISMALVGVLFVVGARLGLGRLAGDLSFTAKNARIYVPIATCVVLSIVATLLLNIFIRK